MQGVEVGVEVCLEGCGDLGGGQGEEWEAGDGACVVDEDCAGAELKGLGGLVVVCRLVWESCGILFRLRTSFSIDSFAFWTSAMLDTSHL